MSDARLDAAPLLEPVPREAVREYRKAAIARGDAPSGVAAVIDNLLAELELTLGLCGQAGVAGLDDGLLRRAG